MNEPRTSGDSTIQIENMTFSERLGRLDEAEKNIVQAMLSAAQCFAELSKDKIAPRQVENHAQDFCRRLQFIEKTILSQICYLNEVGVGAAHEGSAYSQLRSKLSAEEKLNHVYQRLLAYDSKLKVENEETMDCVESSSEMN